MARAVWTVVGVTALVVSYVACQNTWRGLKQDARENAALARKKAQDARLDDTARAVGEEARAAAHRAGEGLKKAAGNLRPRDEAPPATGAPPVSAPPSAASRELNEAIGKVAAKAREASVHLDVEKALARESGLDASHVDIDADDATRTIVLSGSVPDAVQRAAAARIAAENAPGYKIRNELATIARP